MSSLEERVCATVRRICWIKLESITPRSSPLKGESYRLKGKGKEVLGSESR